MLPFEPPTFGADDNDFFNAMNAGLWSGNFTASADCPSGKLYLAAVHDGWMVQ